MNIFYVDTNPYIAAEYLCDKHVVKMILESAQMLSTAHRLLDGKLTEYEEFIPKFKNINGFKVGTGWITKKKQKYVLTNVRDESKFYKVAHKNHPSSIWVRQSDEHYRWLYEHFDGLCEEYTRRYGKVHATELKLALNLFFNPKQIKKAGFTPPPCCMPDECKLTNDAVINYQYYYVTEKKSMLKYTKREAPHWITEGEIL